MKVYTGNPNSTRKHSHRMPRKVAKKSGFECLGGPLDGHVLFLEHDGKTAVFTINGQTGRYDNGEWKQC